MEIGHAYRIGMASSGWNVSIRDSRRAQGDELQLSRLHSVGCKAFFWAPVSIDQNAAAFT
jgi:hypothetical protein